jgi:hypothetical protein
MESLTFRAVVENEQLIRPPAGVELPRGAVEVTVRPLSSAEASGNDSLASTRAWLLGMAAEVERLSPNLPADLAEHHDHYAHGKPLP